MCGWKLFDSERSIHVIRESLLVRNSFRAGTMFFNKLFLIRYATLRSGVPCLMSHGKETPSPPSPARSVLALGLIAQRRCQHFCCLYTTHREESVAEKKKFSKKYFEDSNTFGS